MVPVADSTNASPRAADLEEVCRRFPDVTLWANPERIGHTGGDLSAFWKGLTWAADRRLDVLGKVSQRFGCTGYRREPRRGGCRHFHDGLDIAGRPGSRVRAAFSGVVAYAGWNPWDAERRAYIVIVGHRGGFHTVYGHLRPVRKARVGKTVRRGQVIGFMGSTGNSSGPHLHWEVRKGTTALDPGRFR